MLTSCRDGDTGVEGKATLISGMLGADTLISTFGGVGEAMLIETEGTSVP
jgi:hypothetical protein